MNGAFEMSFIDKKLLSALAEKYAVSLDAEAIERFDLYAELLVDWNEKINLTAITEPREIVVKHFADSLCALKYVDIPVGASVIDVGTGAGFPGAALLIARPDIKLTALDSTGKKLTVIENILDRLGLNAQTLHMRAEEASRKKEYREKYDFAFARAVAPMVILSEYCLPFVKTGGTFVAMKAAKAAQELNEAQGAIKLLGGELSAFDTFELEDAGERSILQIKKVQQTSPKYPRQAAKIAKNPLR